MATYSVAEARNNLSKLIEKAGRGESIEITRHGKVAARLVGPEDAKPPADWRAALDYVIANPVVPKRPQRETGAELVRRLRDESGH